MSKTYRALVGQSHPVDAAEDKRIQDLTAAGTSDIPDRQMAHFDVGEIVTWMPERNIQDFIDAGYIEEVPSDAMTREQLDAYALSHGIDVSGMKSKAEVLALLEGK